MPPSPSEELTHNLRSLSDCRHIMSSVPEATGTISTPPGVSPSREPQFRSCVCPRGSSVCQIPSPVTQLSTEEIFHLLFPPRSLPRRDRFCVSIAAARCWGLPGAQGLLSCSAQPLLDELEPFSARGRRWPLASTASQLSFTPAV